MSFTYPDLKGKTVLEIGAGEGASTREVAGAIVAAGGGYLIVNDIEDTHFPALRRELTHPSLELVFLRSSAVKLAGLANASVDLVVSNYALGAIEAIQGQAVLALSRFFQVLKPGGMLLIREELPVYMAANPAQRLWADKMSLLRAVQILTGQKQFKEFQPEVLVEILELLGYTDVDYQDELANHASEDWLPSYLEQMARLTQDMEAADKQYFSQKTEEIKGKAEELGSFEQPYYQVWASKPWRSLE